ncbi:MAG: hypothetical protein KBD64_03690 [Gammaproteobacteria bacterium]|nr:hypothetical protein [Gammaproteobacteria bacterium]
MKILILCNNADKTAATIGEHITSFIKYSAHEFELFNCIKNKLTFELLNKYDAVMIHYSIIIEMNYCLLPSSRYVLSRYTGLKMIFLQDENRNVNKLVDCIKYLRINIVFTCLPESEIQKVYSADKLPGVHIISVLTGYVPKNLIEMPLTELTGYKERKLDVVYRARILSASFGRSCYDKYIIAEKLLADAEKYNLKVDISVLENDRLYGKAWIDFLLSSKACLGVESGASLFDYTGEIRNKVERHELLNPGTSFEELENLYFKNLDFNVDYLQISPRHFEAAALKTLMILYEGKYSGILQPWRHYVPLKKDHSNIIEVISVLNNEVKWKEITDYAYEEVANNSQYSFEYFIEQFDSIIEKVCQAEDFSLNKENIINNAYSNKTSVFKKITSALCLIFLYVLSVSKYIVRRVGEKIFWWLEKITYPKSRHPNFVTRNFYKLTNELFIYVKNRLRLFVIKLRNYDKSRSKFLVLLSIIYYKFYFNKTAVKYKNNDVIFCIHDQDREETEIKSIGYELLFKKVKICDNCRMFVGF